MSHSRLSFFSSRMLKKSASCLVHLICWVCLVYLVLWFLWVKQQNKPDRPDEPDRPQAGSRNWIGCLMDQEKFDYQSPAHFPQIIRTQLCLYCYR